MIRPVTCVCLLAATLSGFYLYQTKHRTRMLDRQIEQTMQQAAAVRERSAQLRTEWSLLNDASRLADLAGRHLSLHQVSPAQYVTMADLDRRLPATRVFGPADAAPLPTAVPMAQASPVPAAVPSAVPSPGPAAVAQAVQHPAPVLRLAAAAPPAVQSPASPAPPAASVPPPGPVAPRVMAEKPPEKPLHEVVARETVPAPKPMMSQAPTISQVMATSAPVMTPRPVATRIAAYGQRMASAAASEAVGRIVRGETPYSVSSAGSALGAARTMLAPPVPVPVSGDATMASRVR